MAKKPKTKQPFNAKTMGSVQRGIALSRGRKEARTALENASPVTVIRPDGNGDLVEITTVAPVATKPAPRPKRPRVPKGSRSLL